MREDELIIYQTTRNNGFKVNFDRLYRQSRLNTNWANPAADIGNKRLFLNQFRCHLPHAISTELLPVLEGVSPLFVQVRNIEIQDLTENEEIYPIIAEIFDTLRCCANKFRETATGKFMHMTCPNLFTMIDSKITAYMQRRGIIRHRFTTSRDYINLLRYYCCETNELFEDVMQAYAIDRPETRNRILEKDTYAEGSIPRIIDKHFYWLATR